MSSLGRPLNWATTEARGAKASRPPPPQLHSIWDIRQVTDWCMRPVKNASGWDYNVVRTFCRSGANGVSVFVTILQCSILSTDIFFFRAQQSTSSNSRHSPARNDRQGYPSCRCILLSSCAVSAAASTTAAGWLAPCRVTSFASIPNKD